MGEPEKARKLFKAGLERCPDHVHLHQVFLLSTADWRWSFLSMIRKASTLLAGFDGQVFIYPWENAQHF